VSCSPRGPAAESYRLSQKIIGFLLRNQPTATVIQRIVSGGVLAHIDEDYAMSQHGTADVSQEGTAAQSEQLIRELQSADVVVIATPMNNYTLPSSLKLWIDHVVRVRWTFNVSREGKVGLLRDRPVFVAVSSAGRYSGANVPREFFLRIRAGDRSDRSPPATSAFESVTQRQQVTLDCLQIQAFELSRVVEIRVRGIGLRGVLLQQIDPQLVWPPVAVGSPSAGNVTDFYRFDRAKSTKARRGAGT
jgi:FMN-dependent NADH-azoreductase